MKTNKSPWTVKEYDTQIEVINNLDEIIAFIPIDDEIEPLENDVSNANLIASAPCLLEALDNLISRGLIKDTIGDHYDEVLEVIKKARGEL